MLYAIVGMLVIILDQGVKFWVTNHIMLDTVTEPLIPGVISLVRMHNDGAAFSFLAGGGARIYFIILTGVFTLAVILALVTNFINGRFGRWCLVLVTAGGLSNCLDRILYGYVVDMFKVDLFDFAVFNVADIFITVFCLLFIIYIIFGGEDKKKAEDEFDVDDEDLDRPKYEKRDRKAERLAAKEEKAAAKLAKRDKKRGSKYEDEEEEFAERFGGRKRQAAAEAPAQRGEGRRRAADEGDMPQRGAERRARSSASQSAEAPARRSANAPARKTRYEEDYETFMAARPNAKAEIARKSAGNAQSDDPFAAWERANARLENRHSSTARAMGVAAPESGEAQFRRPTAPDRRAAGAAEAPARRERSPEERAAAQQALRERAAAAAEAPARRERAAAAEAPARRERAAAPAEAPARRERAAASAQAPARRAAALPEYETEIAPARPAQRPAPAPAPKADDGLEFSLDDILSEFR